MLAVQVVHQMGLRVCRGASCGGDGLSGCLGDGFELVVAVDVHRWACMFARVLGCGGSGLLVSQEMISSNSWLSCLARHRERSKSPKK